MNFKVYDNGELVAEFENQKTDFEPFKYVLNHQSQSVMWAIKYGGWKIEQIDDNGKVSYWK